MRRKNLWLRLSSCTMAALIATTSIVPVSAADMDFQDEVSAETPDTEAEEVSEAPEAEAQEDISLTTEENTDQAAEELQDAEDTAELTAEDGFSDGEAVVQEADAVSDTVQTGFGSANTNLEKGTYAVTVTLMNADDPTKESMAASCIAGKGTLVVAEDGSAKLTVPIQAASVAGQTAYAKDWKVYTNSEKTESAAAEYTTDADGNVDSITFAILDKTQDGVYVSMYIELMGRTQDAFMSVDYANAEKDQLGVDTTALEAAIAQADALDEMSYTKASWDGNKEAIDTANAAAKEALEKKESQEAVDAAATVLTDALGKLVEAGDPTELQELINQAKGLKETDYTVKSVSNYWDRLQKEIANAETAIADRETASTLSRCVYNLQSDIKSLVKAYSTTELEKTIAKAEALNEEDYTADSWAAANIKGAISTAKTTIASRGSKDDVRVAMDTLETAMDKLVAVNITVGRGDFARKLKPGTYSLPIEILNGAKSDITNQYTSADFMSYTSMAAGCFTGKATLVIHEDGTATLTTGVQAITSMGLTGAASDWTIYESTQDYLDGKANSSTGARYKAHVDKTATLGGKKKPSQITFDIPDLKQNVAATRMYIEVMKVEQDACIGFDWNNVEKISDDTTAASSFTREYVVNADTLTQLKNLKAGNTVKLDADITLTEDLKINGGTVDLNGYALNLEDNLLITKGDVTIIDSSEGKTGKITRAKYEEKSDTSTSISVQRGTFKADGITIDGQIGNRVYTKDQFTLNDLPRIAVVLSNCNFTNTVDTSSYESGDKNIAFINLANGVDLTVDNCTFDKGIKVGGESSSKTTITNSSMPRMEVSGASATVKNVTTKGAVTIGAAEMVISDDEFAGLEIGGTGDVTLEKVSVTKSARNGGALTLSGSGTVTIKDGVFTNKSSKGYAVAANGYKVKIEGGYFLGKTASVNGAYELPEGKIFGDVTEGDYAGYQTLVDGKDAEVTDPVATIYNPDGSVAKLIDADKADISMNYVESGQTLKLNKDMRASSLSYYKNSVLDLNGYTLTTEEGINGKDGICEVIDSSTSKTGKLISSGGIFTGNSNTTLILNNVICEAQVVQGMSNGDIYIKNGTIINNVFMLDALMASGKTYIQDSTWTIAETDYDGNSVDGLALLENTTRTSQYTITQTGDRTFTVTANDLGKAMRAFEAIDTSAYTKASYAAAKAVYDEIDGSADEDIQGDVVAQKAKELNDAVAKLQTVATAKSVSALKSAVTAGKKLKSTDYTASTFKTFTTALTSAEKVLNNADHSEAQVTAATKSLAAAKAKLVKKNTQTITVTVKNTRGTVTKKYGDKAFTIGAKAKGGLTYKSSNTKVATVDSKGKVTIKGAGAARITITAKATSTYKAATKDIVVKVAKKTPSITTKISSKTISYNTLKKKSQVFTLGTAVASKGTLTYKKLSGTSAITVNSKTGKFTVKKGLKKGTYRVKVQIRSAAKGNYNAAIRTMTVTVKVK